MKNSPEGAQFDPAEVAAKWDNADDHREVINQQQRGSEEKIEREELPEKETHKKERAESDIEYEDRKVRQVMGVIGKFSGLNLLLQKTGAKEKIDNYFRGRDVSKEIEGSALFNNREAQMAVRTQLVREITGKTVLIENFNSHLRQYDNRLDEFKRIRDLHIAAAGGQADIVEDANRMFEERSSEINKFKEQINKDKTRIVAEKEEIEARRKKSNELIEEDNQGMRTIVEQKILEIKGAKYDEHLGVKNNLEARIREATKEANLLAARIGGLRRSLPFYSKEEAAVKEKQIAEEEKALSSVNKDILQITTDKDRVAAVLAVFDTRIASVTKVKGEFGIEDTKKAASVPVSVGASYSGAMPPPLPETPVRTEAGTSYSDVERLTDELAISKKEIRRSPDEKSLNSSIQKAVKAFENIPDNLQDEYFGDSMKDLRNLRNETGINLQKKIKRALDLIGRMEYGAQRKSLEEEEVTEPEELPA